MLGDIIMQKSSEKIPLFVSSQQQIEKDPNNGQAWYTLYLCHSRGHWGAPCRNESEAMKCLQKAFDLNCPDAITHMERLHAERAARQSIEDGEARRMAAAKLMFESKEGLETAIQHEIYPCIVSIETDLGYGTGFFQYSEWLISNAHVVPSRDVLANATFTGYSSVPIELNVEQSYHRPCFINAPDLVIINAQKPPEHSNKCLPYIFSDDWAHEQTLFFYVNINPYSDTYEVNYLRQLPHSSSPLIFTCEDGKTPMPGASGAPIIEARVISDHIPQWQFKVVGALYARCSAIWYNKIFNNTQSFSDADKLVCAIPVASDLSQILQLLFDNQKVDRAGAMASAAAYLGDEQAERDNMRYLREQELARQTANLRLTKFEWGESPLCILLPDGLEKLAGSGFSKLRDSYLKQTADLNDEEISETFKSFIKYVSTISNLNISVTKETTILTQQYWRLDCKPGEDNRYWLLQLQDNTGKGKKVLGTKKSASSIFAEVKVPKNITSINGQPLAMDLLRSHKKIENDEKCTTIKIDIEGEGTDKLFVKIKMAQYKKTALSRASSCESLALFQALPEENYNGTSLVKKYASDIDRINKVNALGNTPLMQLLKDAELTNKPGQMKKAGILAEFSIWNQKNNDGKTAEEILRENPNKNPELEALLPSFD